MGKLPCLVLRVVLLIRSRMRWAICKTTSFSLVPRGPIAPGSSPPWPGSSATMMKRSPSWLGCATEAAEVKGADAVGSGNCGGSVFRLGLTIKSPTGSECVPNLEGEGAVGVAVIEGAL